DLVGERDARGIVAGCEPRPGDRMRAMPCSLDGWEHRIPRVAAQPETGNQDDVHAATLAAAPVTRHRHASRVVERPEPLLEDARERLAIGCREQPHETVFVGDVVGEGRIDELPPAVGEADPPAASVGRVGRARHESRGLVAVDALGYGTRGYHRVPRELAGRKLEGSTRATQRREHVEVALAQAVLAIHGDQLVAQPIRPAVQAADDGLARRVEGRALAAPLILDAIDAVVGKRRGHTGIIPSTEGLYLPWKLICGPFSSPPSHPSPGAPPTS